MRAMALARSGVLAVVLAAGCGGGGGGDNSPAPSPSPSPDPAASVTIEIAGELGDRSFNPNPATPGQTRTVAWRNANGVVHRIVANDNSFDTGNLNTGATSRSITIPAEGINYHCSLHPGMVGAITGSSGTAPPCEGQYCAPGDR